LGLFDYNNLSYIEAKSKVAEIKNRANLFTMLWHNSYIEHIKFYGELIEKRSIKGVLNNFTQ